MRFEGNGAFEVVLSEDIGRDPADCEAAFRNGSASVNSLFVRPASANTIIFGDNISNYARDGECGDIRFVHAEPAGKICLFDDVGHDADDCKAGFEAGTLRWQGDLANPVHGLTSQELGDDWDYIF